MRAHALLAIAATLPFAGIARADDDTSEAAIKAARAYAVAVLGDDCAIDQETLGDEPYFADTADTLEWTYKWSDQPEHGTLYSFFCFMGAYNVGRAYAFKGDGLGLQIISFAEPETDFDYVDEDQTKLKAPPRVVGFSTSMVLVNPEFDKETKTIVSHSRWRGLGDAWSSGQWTFENGRFVLKQFDLDPTYELDSEDLPDDQPFDEFYTVYKAD